MSLRSWTIVLDPRQIWVHHIKVECKIIEYDVLSAMVQELAA